MSTENFDRLKFYIIIPAHNEEKFIEQTLQSLVAQDYRAEKIIVVDDNSTDSTPQIVTEFCERYDYIDLIENNSSPDHLPGSKVVRAFYQGLTEIGNDFDIICKFDADLIFPKNYLSTLAKTFYNHPKIGLAGGFCYIEDAGKWAKESLTDNSHVRGALKAYRKACFEDIGGLKEAVGWDTLDELLAQYHGWKVSTIEELQVKHLRPTGKSYKKSSSKKVFGEALYQMQYGMFISFISSAKMAWLKKDPALLQRNIKGYLSAKKNKLPYLVTDDEGKWIRKYRWKRMKKKLLGK